MCGIIGYFTKPQSPNISNSGFEQLLSMMHRRGPDDGGVWSDGRHCALGFRRLSILDLTPTGRQPMLTAGGRYALVFNGEVYNFQEIRARLAQRGVRFRSSGDSEVVLYALAEWGPAALECFNGMFALAFYDAQEKRLLLARDFAGIKPLYVLKTPQGVVFASQYDQILAHPWAAQVPFSQDGLAQYLRMGYIPAPYAAHESVAMLEPGTWLEVNAGGSCRRGRYFAFPAAPQPDLRGQDAYDAVDSAVSSAVRRQMVSDVPLGAFLSGGIDSPLVVAKMRAASGGSLTSFTIGTAGSSLDESQDAAAYAQELGVEQVLQQVTPDDALGLLDDVVSACSEPFADYSIFPTLLVSRLARTRVKVMLSGDGGDELFWGYPGRFGSAIARAPYFRHPQWLRKMMWSGWRLRSGNARLWSIQHFRTLGDWYRGHHSHLSEGWARKIFPDLPPWPAGSPLFCYNGSDPDETAHWVRWNEFTGHLSMVLLKVDRASMHNSLEVRVPLLDKEVIQTASRVDWRSCIDLRTGVGKMPLRKSLSRHVARQTEGKKGFSVPMAEWLRGPLRGLLEEKVLRQRGLFGFAFHQPALQAYYKAHLQGSMDNSWGLWILLSAALWQEKHGAAYARIRQ